MALNKHQKEIELATQLAREAAERKTKFTKEITEKLNQNRVDYSGLRSAVRTIVNGGRVRTEIYDDD